MFRAPSVYLGCTAAWRLIVPALYSILTVPTFAARCTRRVLHDARAPSSERWNYLWARNLTSKFCVEMLTSMIHSRVLLHAVNLWHGTDGFTSPLKEGVRRIFSPLKIRRLRPGFKLRTWVLKANTLPLDHRSRFAVLCLDSGNDQEQPKQFLTFLSLFNRLGDRYVCNCFLQQKSSSITMSVQYVTLQYFKFYNP